MPKKRLIKQIVALSDVMALDQNVLFKFDHYHNIEVMPITKRRSQHSQYIVINAHLLERMLKHSEFAMSKRDKLAHYDALLLQISHNTLTIVGTDFYRMSVVSTTKFQGEAEVNEIVIYRNAIVTLLKLLRAIKPEQVTVSFNENENDDENIYSPKNVRFQLNSITLNTKPQYQYKCHSEIFHLWKKMTQSDKNRRIAVINTCALKKTLSDIESFGKQVVDVQLKIESNYLKIIFEKNDVVCSSEVPILMRNMDFYLERRFNLRYMVQGLRRITNNTVNLSFFGNNDYCEIISDDQFSYYMKPSEAY